MVWFTVTVQNKKEEGDEECVGEKKYVKVKGKVKVSYLEGSDFQI